MKCSHIKIKARIGWLAFTPYLSSLVRLDDCSIATELSLTIERVGGLDTLVYPGNGLFGQSAQAKLDRRASA